MAPNAEDEDGEGNIAWRPEENENEMFTEDDFNTGVDYNEVRIDELEKMERAREFIEIGEKVKKLKDGQMKKLKDVAKGDRQSRQVA